MTPMEELREQAAKIADDHGETWGLAYKSMTDTIAAAIRNIPLPAPVALPQAGEVEPVKCAVCGIANRNHHTHLAPFHENYHEFEEVSSAIPAAAVGEICDRCGEYTHDCQCEPGTVPENGDALPTPDDGQQYRDAVDSLHQIKNMDPQEMAKSTWFVRQLVDEALEALSQTTAKKEAE